MEVSFRFTSLYTNLRPGNTLVFQAPFAGSALFESFPSRYKGTIGGLDSSPGAPEGLVAFQKTGYGQRSPILWRQPQLDWT